MFIIALDIAYCHAGSRLRLSAAKQFLVNVIMLSVVEPSKQPTRLFYYKMLKLGRKTAGRQSGWHTVRLVDR
jgi:hypothetical protein